MYICRYIYTSLIRTLDRRPTQKAEVSVSYAEAALASGYVLFSICVFVTSLQWGFCSMF